METDYPGEAQKYILGMQGQNQACQTSTGIKTGEECGGSKEDTVIGTRGRLRKTGLLCPRDKGYSKT